MPQPITWKNVNTASQSPSELMTGARQSFNSGFGALSDYVKTQQDTAKSNINKTRDVNTQDFLNHLAGYQDPNHLQQDINSGAIAKSLATYGGAVDSAKVRDAAAQRLTALQHQSNTNDAFHQDQLQQQYRQPDNQFYTNMNEGNFKQAQAYLDQNPTDPNAAKLSAALSKAKDQAATDAFTKADRANKVSQWDQAKKALDQKNFGNQAVSSVVQNAETQRANSQKAVTDYVTQQGWQAQAPGKQLIVDGNVDISQLNADQKNQLYTHLHQNNMLPPSDTQIHDNLVQKLMASNKNYTLAQANKLASQAVSGIDQSTALSGQDAAKYKTALSTVNTQYGQQIAQLKTNYQKELKHNMFTDAGNSDPNTVLTSAMKPILGDKFNGVWNNAPYIQQILTDTNKFMTKGVPATDGAGKPIIGNDGKPIMMPVPPSIIKAAAQNIAEYKWTHPDTSFNDYVVKAMHNPEMTNEFVKYKTATQHFNENLNQLQANQIRDQQRVHSAYNLQAKKPAYTMSGLNDSLYKALKLQKAKTSPDATIAALKKAAKNWKKDSAPLVQPKFGNSKVYNPNNGL